MDEAAKWLPPPTLWARLKPIAREMRALPTPAEDCLWDRLRSRQLVNLKFRRQHPIGRFIVDFYCAEAQLIIEVDGGIHQYTVEEDAIRQEYLEGLGFKVLRFTNDQVLDVVDSCLKAIVAALPTPFSPSLRSGEGARG